MRLQPIVEGHGDVDALPVLLRRLGDEAGLFDLEIGRCIRCPRGKLVKEPELRKIVRLAGSMEECGGILILFDSDGECPAQLGPRMQTWAQSEAGAVPCQVVAAHCEYEAWFLGAIESLRGHRGVRSDARSPEEPEAIRDAKGTLGNLLERGRSYLPTIDQPALTSALDLGSAHRRCRSFRRLVRSFGVVVASGRLGPSAWPPTWAV